jgi:hypothetical protein
MVSLDSSSQTFFNTLTMNADNPTESLHQTGLSRSRHSFCTSVDTTLLLLLGTQEDLYRYLVSMQSYYLD